MPAEIANIAGNSMFASLREVPWHRQGTVFDEEVTGEEMLRIAKLDWEVEKRPIMTIDNEGEIIDADEYKMVTRKDNGDRFNVVKPGFELFQNSEIIGYFEGLAQDRKIVYETAGGLGNGGVVWVMARIPDLDFSIKGDETKSYMMIKNGHDGSSSLWAVPTNVRVVCANTMRMAMEERRGNGKSVLSKGFSIRHTKNMRDAVSRVQQAYGSILRAKDATVELMEHLASIELSQGMIDDVFDFAIDPVGYRKAQKGEFTEDSIFGKENDLNVATDSNKPSRKETIRRNKREKLERIFNSPTNQQPGTRNTAYSLVQTVVEWIDHEKSSDETKRFESAQFGAGDVLKGNVLDFVLQDVI